MTWRLEHDKLDVLPPTEIAYHNSACRQRSHAWVCFSGCFRESPQKKGMENAHDACMSRCLRVSGPGWLARVATTTPWTHGTLSRRRMHTSPKSAKAPPDPHPQAPCRQLRRHRELSRARTTLVPLRMTLVGPHRGYRFRACPFVLASAVRTRTIFSHIFVQGVEMHLSSTFRGLNLSWSASLGVPTPP